MRKHANKEMAMSKINHPQIERELEFLDSRIEEEEYKLKQHEMLVELFGSDSFKQLVLEDYMEGEAERLTKAITTPDGMKREHIQSAVDKLVSIRHLRAWLANVEMEVQFAGENLEDLKSTKDDVKANPGKYIDTEEDE